MLYCIIVLLLKIKALQATWKGHLKKNELWLLLPVSHCEPLTPGAQLQLNPFTRSVQVPLFLQGSLSQSSISGLEGKIERIKMQYGVFISQGKRPPHKI